MVIVRHVRASVAVGCIALLCAVLATRRAQAAPANDRTTIVLSDLHMGIGRDPSGAWHPFEDARWASELGRFLTAVDAAGQSAVDLVLNGDTHGRKRLVAFAAGADVMIHDAQYLDNEYPRYVGWGHSCLTEVLKLAAEAKVRRLYLYHHDPYQNDEAVAAKEAFGRQYFAERGLEIECLAAAEGHSISI